MGRAMAVNMEHKEFFQVDFGEGWERLPGYPEGTKIKILAGSIDQNNKSGGYTTEPFEHDYWEEVYVLDGDLITNSNPDGTGGEAFGKGTYCCRPPGASHGSFRSEGGSLLLESHYYDPQ